jgi:hypothetical protein
MSLAWLFIFNTNTDEQQAAELPREPMHTRSAHKHHYIKFKSKFCKAWEIYVENNAQRSFFT